MHRLDETQLTTPCHFTGTIARVGLNDLVTDDPIFVKHMCNVKTEYRRSSWYDGMRFNPTSNNCLSTRDEAAHSALRSKMAAGVCVFISSTGNFLKRN